MNKHYCQDTLKSVAIFAKAKSCQHAQTVACPVHGSMTVADSDAKDCCNNESEYLKLDADWLSFLAADLTVTAAPAILPATWRLQLRALSQQPFVWFQVAPFHPPPLRQRLARLQSYLC